MRLNVMAHGISGIFRSIIFLISLFYPTCAPQVKSSVTSFRNKTFHFFKHKGVFKIKFIIHFLSCMYVCLPITDPYTLDCNIRNLMLP